MPLVSRSLESICEQATLPRVVANNERSERVRNIMNSRESFPDTRGPEHSMCQPHAGVRTRAEDGDRDIAVSGAAEAPCRESRHQPVATLRSARTEPSLHLPSVDQSRLLKGGLSVAQDHEVGDAADAKAGGEARVLVGVDLQDQSAPAHVVGDGLHLRRRRLAGPAPGGPEVDEDGDTRGSDDGIEVGFVDVEGDVDGGQGPGTCRTCRCR